MYTGETPHKCKQCDFTSIIASHLKRHYEKDACFISGYKILRSSVLNVLLIVFEKNHFDILGSVRVWRFYGKFVGA